MKPYKGHPLRYLQSFKESGWLPMAASARRTLPHHHWLKVRDRRNWRKRPLKNCRGEA